MTKDLDFVHFWANKFKEDPKKYRKTVYKFVDAQIALAQARLNKLPPEKIIKIFQIKNEQLISTLMENSKKEDRS